MEQPILTCKGNTMILDQIPFAKGARFSENKTCLPGTRVDVLKEIVHWAVDPEETRRVLLFTGPAGAGKSMIAHTVAGYFKKAGCLAASFCFDRNSRAERGPDKLFSTISRSLADVNMEFRNAL